MVYDGGTQESGQNLVTHIRTHYGTNRVDYVVNSHPDADHASGLAVVLEQMEVGELWMHRPWNYSKAIHSYFDDGRMTPASLAERLKTKMAAAHALEKIALDKKIPIKEPFRGEAIGEFIVLSPERDWYVHTLIPEFEKSPELKKSADTIAEAITKALRTAGSWISEAWGTESLRENVETSAENESSVILLGVIRDHGILLTGDAGIRAQRAAADCADALEISLPSILKFVQVPHHGSRHNVSTSVIDRILGPRKTTNDGLTSKIAFVSAGKDSKTHPRKMVVNAFIRRGSLVIATQGQSKCYREGMPQRDGWIDATPLSFSNVGESWE